MLISEFSFIEFFCNFNRNLFLIWVFLFYKNFYEEIYSCENFCLILLFNYNFQVQVFIYFIFEEEKNFLTLFKNQYFFFPSVTDENLIYSMSYIWICVLWWKIISKILFFSIKGTTSLLGSYSNLLCTSNILFKFFQELCIKLTKISRTSEQNLFFKLIDSFENRETWHKKVSFLA